MINRENWLIEEVTSKSKPTWNCPSCMLGTLEVKKDSIIVRRNFQTKTENEHYLHQNPFVDTSHFGGLLSCNQPKCGEQVGFIGESGFTSFEENYPLKPKILRYYKPSSFYPNLKIFPLSHNCPKEITIQVNLSFDHFFNDVSASANSIRTALELIMDKEKVDKTKINKNTKRINLTLHERIETFGKINPTLKPFLLAVKWIGNAGSHKEKITKEHLLDLYELLEHCIAELYDNPKRLKELSRKAKKINATKKPLKP